MFRFTVSQSLYTCLVSSNRPSPVTSNSFESSCLRDLQSTSDKDLVPSVVDTFYQNYPMYYPPGPDRSLKSVYLQLLHPLPSQCKFAFILGLGVELVGGDPVEYCKSHARPDVTGRTDTSRTGDGSRT